MNGGKISEMEVNFRERERERERERAGGREIEREKTVPKKVISK